MERRRFLGVAAGLAAVGTVAGCTAPANDGTGGGGATETTSATADTPADTTTTSGRTDTLAGTEPGSGTTESPSAGDPATRTGRIDGVDYAVDVTGADCASDERGTVDDVAFDEGAGKVVVTGTILAATPCRTVDVSAIEYDEGAGTVAVTVATADRTGSPDACTECIGALDYEARFRFTDGFPSEVTVSHDGVDGRREVASAGYGSAGASEPTTSE